MDRRHKITFFITFSLCQLLYWLAFLIVTIANDPQNGVTYNIPTPLSSLLKGFTRINIEAIVSNFREFSIPTILFLCITSVSFYVFLKTSTELKDKLRFAVFALQPIVFFWGCIGLLLIPQFVYEFIRLGGLDGETLIEGDPLIIAGGVWILCALYVAFTSFDKKWLCLESETHNRSHSITNEKLV